MYGVLGLGNYKLDGGFKNAFDLNVNDPTKQPDLKNDAPGVEYKQIGLFFGNIM